MKKWWKGFVGILMTDHTEAYIDGITSCFYNPKNHLIDEKILL